MSYHNISKFTIDDLVQFLLQSSLIVPKSFKVEVSNFSFTATYHISNEMCEVLSPTMLERESVFYLPSNIDVAIISLNRKFLNKGSCKTLITIETKDASSMKSILKLIESGTSSRVVSGNYKVISLCNWFVSTYLDKSEDVAVAT
jgi:hypothetical protein